MMPKGLKEKSATFNRCELRQNMAVDNLRIGKNSTATLDWWNFMHQHSITSDFLK